MIFIDFGGVISTDEFWLSLRQEGHPLREQVEAGMERVWHEQPGISQAWMRGELGFSEEIAEMGLGAAGWDVLHDCLQGDAGDARASWTCGPAARVGRARPHAD